MQITFTRAGFWRGVHRAFPLAAGLAPFGFVTGLVTAHHGLSLLDCVLMNAFVYTGAAQLVALANWTHPAPIVAAAFAAFVVNSRFALMDPVLAPWLDGLGLAGRYANLLAGLRLPVWAGWQISTTAGFLLARTLNLPPHHPIFFGALAAFLALLVPLWRGRADILPWLVAGFMAALTVQFLPHTSWYILIGALSGCLAGAVMDRRNSTVHG